MSISVDASKCNGCTGCVKACPTAAIEIKDKLATIALESCTMCGACVSSCRFNAISIDIDKQPVEDLDKFGMSLEEQIAEKHRIMGSGPEAEHGLPEVVQEDLEFDPMWLTDSLKEVSWTDATVKSYLLNVCKVDTSGTVIEVVSRLTREQREQFFAEIQKGLDKPHKLL